MGGAVLLAGVRARTAARPWSGDAVAAGLLDPAAIPKYVTPLPVPPVMPALGPLGGPADRYEIGVRRFRQQILPPGHPPTMVFGYGSSRHPETFSSPGWTVEARAGRPVEVRWVNELVGRDGGFLPHPLPVDQTLHWANPGGGTAGRDSRPHFTTTPGPYHGPVPIVTHLHGGRNPADSDGYPEAWYLPDARNLPAGYAKYGTKYADYAALAEDRDGRPWGPGAAVFRYPNDQRAATLWYHDHVLGMTRLNVYAGLAGFYLLRGGPGDLPTGVLPGPGAGEDGGGPYEIPIVVQDRSFAPDGSLHYPLSRRDFDRFPGPYIPHSDVPPIWQPEFFGTAMMVNGRTWPYLDVRPRRFRFRFLNGCNARTLDLKIVTSPTARRPVPAALPFWQIGADAGFLPAPQRLGHLLLAPAERADVIVDFTGIPAGTALYLVNEGPDGPFRGDPHARPADPATTGQVLKFMVLPKTGRDTSVPPDRLTLPDLPRLGTESLTRRVALLESTSTAIPGGGPAAALLGLVEKGGAERPGEGGPHGGMPHAVTPEGGEVGRALMWSDPITENPVVGATEVWEIHNFTMDAHPIHVHEVPFYVLDRRPFSGGSHGPAPGETGYKDTVIAYPNQVTRIKALFERPGLYVWHCHILEHEDNEMMRPYRIEG
ncbi:multicopper oxidase family protein [Sphaerisporangium melleum]|nr:multicopper oxidase [Sphaerisporangium melleum]